ncbi:MAG TPA: helix-turn-helix transcriptional regulator [Phycisphaerae bacterium]|nr:helix-turn-helix transcriptional regulator [Phycisphaerae bacterium]
MSDRKAKTFSERLRRFISERPESLAQIGRATGVSHAALSRFLRGKRGLSTRTLDRLCEYLGLELRPSGRRRRKGT